MYPARFDYHGARSVDDAIEHLQVGGDEAKVLAGGQSLIPLMRLRFAAPTAVVDISRITELSGVDSARPDVVTIGALTTESELESSRPIADRVPMLREACRTIADPLVRNRATLGGNLAHADPANDLPAVMLALDAEFVVRGPAGERVVAAADFFVHLFTTALDDTEVLTHLRVPTPDTEVGTAYVKNKRQVGDFPIAAAAVHLSVSEGQVTRARVCVTNAGPTPLRAAAVEAYLEGRSLGDVSADVAGNEVLGDISPSASVRGSERYRRAMFANAVREGIDLALSRVRGGS